MGLTITTLKEQANMPLFKADRRLYLDASRTKVVEEGDPDAAFLFMAPGEEILASEAAKFGLGVPKQEKPAPGAPKQEKPAPKAGKK